MSKEALSVLRKFLYWSFIYALVIACWGMVGCTATGGQAATPAYKMANQQRLKVVEPWLTTYATEHPASAQNVSDQLKVWHIEVDAQQRNTPAPPVLQPQPNP